MGGGATIAVLAGARRTETAYGRFLRATSSFDVLVTNGGTTADDPNRQFDFAERARLPEVAHSAPVNYYFPQRDAALRASGDPRRPDTARSR